MKLLSRLILTALIYLSCLSVSGQSRQAVDSLIAAVNNVREQMPVEKLFLHTDKDNYIQGDTIWFKGCLLDGSYLLPSARSGLLYAEIDDSDSHCVKRILLPVTSGLVSGNIALTDAQVPAGNYTLRAYTNWMRNFGEEYIFNKDIFVASTNNQSTSVTAAFKETDNNVEANLVFTDLNNKPLRMQDIQLIGLNGKQTMFKKNISTGVDGRLDVNFGLPPKTATKNLILLAKEMLKGKEIASLTIPVKLHRPEDIDLQFMPEGGALVNGINTKIGFKAIGEDGRGVDVSGKVFNSKQQEVASFSSAFKGIGFFMFSPQPGEIYTARLNLPNGTSKSYALPAVNPSGTSLKVRMRGDDSVEVTLASRGIARLGYYLIGQSGGVVCYAAYFMFSGESVKIIAKDLFPTGVARFTLLNAAKQPLNERILYIERDDDLRIDVITDAKSYAPHDSIALHLQVTDKARKPVTGNFSLAVTDDSQVKSDTLGSNIRNNLLLTADLKGTVEEPGYYFADKADSRTAALDNLLLTQGWVNYAWPGPATPPSKPMFAAEPEYAVTGTVHNGFNKPLPGAALLLLSHKPSLVSNTFSGKDGRFVFKGLFPVDVGAFVIQANRKSGSDFNVLINVDEFVPPLFKQAAFNTTPWYVNIDTLLLRNRDSKLSQHAAEEKIKGTGIVLKEVVIKDKKIIKGSKNLNGPGGADYILDEAEMEKYGKLTLFELLGKKFGFVSTEGIGETTIYRLKEHIINLVIDGKFIHDMDLDVDTYLHYLTAEDITGIEIMYRPSYALAYDPEFLRKLMGRDDRNVPVFLEVTTRSGNGVFLKKKTNKYLYKPLTFSAAKQFYRPRYKVKSVINGTDLRSTIHWEPNIITDTTGKALVSFYSADKPATYTIIVQGTDLKGRLGFTRKKISIH